MGSGNTITLNSQVGVGVDYDPVFPSLDSTNHTVSGNNITYNGEYGVYVRGSSSCDITGNNMTGNRNGLSLDYSSNHNTVSKNNITNNTDVGVYIRNATFNNVSENTITNNCWGIHFWGSSNNNTVSGNEILNNTERGVVLIGEFNTVSGNTITNTADTGISVGDKYNLVSGNIITNSTYQGAHITGSFNTFFGNYLAYNGFMGFGGAIELGSPFGSYNNVVIGNRIENNIEGIILDRSSNSELKLNTMVGNNRNFAVYGSMLDHFIHDIDTSNTVNGKPVYYLIDQKNLAINPSTHPDIGYLAVVNSAHVTVSGLELKNSAQGLLLAYTTHSQITQNSMLDNYAGVYLCGSSFNTVVSENNITNNSVGVYIDRSSLNNIFRNNIAKNGVGVRIWDSSNNIVSGNNIANCSYGVDMLRSSSNTISGNNIANCSYYGVGMYESSFNTISGNNLTKNTGKGISASISSNNRIYHNNFIENAVQVISYDSVNVWDNDYPSGGNYWSDYAGVDVYSGPDQDQPGSDGIGDTPRVINAQNQDQYPLMRPSARICGKVIFEGITGTTPTEYKIGGVEVHLTRGYDYLETVYTDLDGNFYCSTAGEASELRLVIVLKDKDDIIRVYDFERDPSFPAFLRTPPFRAEAASTVNITMRIDAHNAITYGFNGTPIEPPPQIPGDTNVGADRFAHLAVIYHNTYMAVLFATNYLKLTLDHALPVDVRAFSTEPGVFYREPGSIINIDSISSNWNDRDTPMNREWHEFGHHIMTDSNIGGDNQMPWYTGTWEFWADEDNDDSFETPYINVPELNHWGYVNPSTIDSWAEGFAEFIPLVIAATMTNNTQPGIYHWSGGPSNFEDPWFAWRDEEFTIAAILWDLYDSNGDSYNMTSVFNWAQHEGKDLILEDRISISLNEIWSQISGLAPINLTGVYNAFGYMNLYDSDGDGINDLDELFILHGVFADSPPMQQYNGEEIGRAAYTQQLVRAQNLPDVGVRNIQRDPAPDRTAKPPFPGSFMDLSVINNETGCQISGAGLYVQIVYDQPYESHNYDYTVCLSELPRNVSITLSLLPSKAYVYAEKSGYLTSEPLLINSTFYWETISQPREVLLNHTFYLQPIFRNIAITNIELPKTVVGQGCSMLINVTAENHGNLTETFNVILYANTTTIGTTGITLASGNSTIVTFTWDTTSFALGNYTLWAYAEPVPDETNTDDNTFLSGCVVIASHGWEHEFTAPTGHPVVDFAVYDESLYAAADNKLYACNWSSWDIIDAPTYVTSLEPFQGRLIVGGQSGLYCYDGTAFGLIFSVPTYIKVLGVYNNTLYAGTMLDKPPVLYYCNGTVDNPSDWHVDTGFSAILGFSGVFGSIDSFAVYSNALYVGSGGKAYSFDGTDWSVATNYDDVYAFLDMQVYDGKLYLATRDQGWRKPRYQGGTGFSGRVIEFDGENWTTILDHDYWIYSLGVYDGKLYAGTANKILTYNGTSLETSFNATEGAYYALCFENYDGKIYAGTGNGYILADPAPPKPNPPTTVVPEFPSATILTVFMALTILTTALLRKKQTRRIS